jgi:hypothetical protein
MMHFYSGAMMYFCSGVDTVGGPPSLTIAAWAHHVADRLAQTAT